MRALLDRDVLFFGGKGGVGKTTCASATALAATMPGAEEVALFDRMGALVRGEDDRFDLIVFDTAPTGHTLRLIRMPELLESWIRALSKSRQAMLGIDQDD